MQYYAQECSHSISYIRNSSIESFLGVRILLKMAAKDWRINDNNTIAVDPTQWLENVIDVTAQITTRMSLDRFGYELFVRLTLSSFYMCSRLPDWRDTLRNERCVCRVANTAISVISSGSSILVIQSFQIWFSASCSTTHMRGSGYTTSSVWSIRGQGEYAYHDPKHITQKEKMILDSCLIISSQSRGRRYPSGDLPHCEPRRSILAAGRRSLLLTIFRLKILETNAPYSSLLLK